MKTVLLSIVLVAIIGAVVGFVQSGGKKEDAAAGAVAGAVGTLGCLFQLIVSAIPVVVGLWLFKVFFG